MSRIKPFNALFFNEQKAGHISKLISPPYDVISADENKELRAKSPCNTIHIELGEQGDQGFYEKSAKLISAWQKEGALVRAKEPSIYFYDTEFSYHMAGADRRVSRRGFFALLGVSDYEQGEILRHEHTLKGPKQDRLMLLRATHTNISPIFVLYHDPKLALTAALESAKPAEPVFELIDEKGTRHKLFGVSDSAVVDKVVRDLAQKSVYIADGHHRYETALNFYKELQAAGSPVADAAGWVMTYFCPVSDPGLVIFPYHRLVRGLPKERLSGLMEKIKVNFSAQIIAETFDRSAAPKVFKALDASSADRIIVMIDDQRKAWLLKLKDERGRELKEKMDVEIFKELVLEQALLVTQQEVAEKNYVAFETKEELIVKRLSSEDFQMAFLLRPIPVSKVVECADKNGVMPQKSTYFYPKLPSGLVFRKFE